MRERWNARRVREVAVLLVAASGVCIVLLAAEPTHGRTGPAQPPPATSIHTASSEEGAFLDANRSAMTTMMSGMAIRPTGDVDRDFVHMMVAHHQGAIDMAMAVLRYGHDPVIRRLAQEIVVTQQEEIAAMRRAVGEPMPPSLPAPTSPSRGDASRRHS